MRKYLIVPLAVALMMVALLPTPARAATVCGGTAIPYPTATPSAQSVKQGTTVSYAVSVLRAYSLTSYYPGYNFWSTASVTGLPAGFTATFTSKGYNALHQPIGQLAIKTTTGHLGTYTLRIIVPSLSCGTIKGGPFTLTVTQ